MGALIILNLTGENHQTKGFSKRHGWHVGDIPDAPWLKAYDGSDKGFYRSRYAKERRIWYLVEYNATVDYNDIVKDRPSKCLEYEVPDNGYYMFREIGRRVWSISSDLKVVRLMDEDERQSILKDLDYDEVEEYRRYKDAMEKRLTTIHNK